MKKYKFRKMYFICTNKKVISPNTQMTNAYQFKDIADAVCLQRTGKDSKLWEDKSDPPVDSVEAFYLVPEALYNEVLKDHVE